MATLFVSYRRMDTPWTTGRICDHLANHFGASNVFVDVDSIPLTVDFREFIRRVLDGCDVVVAVVGPAWLGPDGHNRLNDESDWVRLELGIALAKKIPIVPVLIDGTKLPNPQQLPPELHDFAFKNAANLDIANFTKQMERLIESLDRSFENRLIGRRYSKRFKRLWLGGGVAALILGTSIAWFNDYSKPNGEMIRVAGILLACVSFLWIICLPLMRWIVVYCRSFVLRRSWRKLRLSR